eukprot:TRINITY_DN90224_c0_g1_i1.p2 TRINITY_DN90224_c0_g1~~TRINITY_DN90224_c0_g1_i1.p2  ORF type:complete len:133 (+),score=5.98 TRINITY_DN90224_c0_g1_i1:27-425(+)
MSKLVGAEVAKRMKQDSLQVVGTLSQKWQWLVASYSNSKKVAKLMRTALPKCGVVPNADHLLISNAFPTAGNTKPVASKRVRLRAQKESADRGRTYAQILLPQMYHKFKLWVTLQHVYLNQQLPLLALVEME